MPRQTRRAAAPSPVKQQTRQAHTMPTRQQAPPPAPKPVTAPPPQQQATAMTPTTPSNHLSQPQPVAAAAAPQQPGLFAQMATTAAGVAVGSAVGHTLANGVSSIFSGGSSSSSSEPVATEQYQQQPQQQAFQPMTGGGGNACEADARAFTQCLETNNNDMNACQWYLEALKSCQRMAANY